MVVTGSRYRTAAGTGVVAALILVLIFGSPVYVDWANRNTDPATGAWDWFLRLLTWPSWSFDDDVPVRDLVARDIKAILVVVFTAVFLVLLTGAQLARARGGVSQLFAGWAAYIFAAATAGLLAAIVLTNPTPLQSFMWAGAGATYGFFTGWIIGLAALGGRRP